MTYEPPSRKFNWTFVSPNIATRNGNIVWRDKKSECYLEIYLTAQNIKIWLPLGGGIEVFMLFWKK